MIAAASTFDEYARGAWERFVKDPARSRASLDALRGIEVTRVLDVGCGAGHELLPFAGQGAVGVGLDLAPEVGRAGRQLFAEHNQGANVSFIRGEAEKLPFPPGAFDLVICRLVLPYTDNARALKEMARVLRPGGALLLKIHHARYYLREMREALMSRKFLTMIHAARVLLAGAAYHLTGKQPRGHFPSAETFQTHWLLNREAERAGFRIQFRLPDANSLTPSFLIIKQNS